MDQKMRLVRGVSRRQGVTIGAVAMDAGDPFILTAGVAIAATDGSEVQGVIVDDGAIDEENVRAEFLVEGQVWDITVASLTSAQGTRVAAAGSGAFDEGTSTDFSIGWTIENTLVATDTTARVLITRGLIA